MKKSIFNYNSILPLSRYVSWKESVAFSLGDSYDYIREKLEFHQKIIGQHPELYQERSFMIELPFSVTRYEHMYTWFIPFSIKFKVCVIFFFDGQGDIEKASLNNVAKLRHLGVSVRMKC
ncbi:hypothetical protein [Aeromonas sp. 30P]|uniref:hypothetical protein n=1 Tax=Aeromonas sp. 30P TaxID=3452717 RepID=UPI0038D3310E